MSSTINVRALALALLSVLAAGAAHAGVDCPATLGKNRLARTGFASVYQGDPSSMADLAPDRQAATPTGTNVWNFTNSAGLVLVCRYEGTRETVRVDLPAGLRACRQDLGARSVSCQ